MRTTATINSRPRNRSRRARRSSSSSSPALRDLAKTNRRASCTRSALTYAGSKWATLFVRAADSAAVSFHGESYSGDSSSTSDAPAEDASAALSASRSVKRCSNRTSKAADEASANGLETQAGPNRSVSAARAANFMRIAAVERSSRPLARPRRRLTERIPNAACAIRSGSRRCAVLRGKRSPH